MGSLRVLILGGTAEARQLAAALAGDTRYEATISLAGRTREPAAQLLPTRVGGFGGIEGLARYLREQRIGALVDATHPFAARMSANAAAAARDAGVPLLALHRPPWTERPGDRWTRVRTMAEAVAALGMERKTVFVTIGRQDVAPLRAAPWHRYILRSVEPPDPLELPPDVEIVTARGPFEIAGELRLMSGRVDILVTKNAGGTATSAKLDAARTLGIPVVMIERPQAALDVAVTTISDALAWLAERGA